MSYDRFFRAPPDPGGGAALLDRPDTGERDPGQDEWFAIKTNRWSCVCGATREHVAEEDDPHRLIVWPSKDDPNLKRLVAKAHKRGAEARAVPYEKSLGPCLSFYEWRPS